MKKRINIILIILLGGIVTLSIGYSSISNVSLDIGGQIVASATKGVHIADIKLLEGDGTLKVNSYNKSLLNSTVVLNDSNTSYVTYEITFYNNSSYDYYFRKVEYTDDFYDNSDIIYTLSDISTSTVIKSKNSLTVKITFKYKDDVVSSNKTLNSCLNFLFANSSSVVKDTIVGDYVADKDVSKLPEININDLDDDTRKEMFSTPATDSGLYRTTGIYGEESLVFRGNDVNNYFLFGTYLWRILQIDEDGNLRLILDSSIGTYAYNSTSTIESIDKAPDTLGYQYSLIKDKLNNWYDTLNGYQDYIVSSKFCLDYNYITMTSSGSGNKVYYFQSYQNVGPDSGIYNPSFSCPLDNIYESKIGLITAEEYVMSGGAFNKETTNSAVYSSNMSNYYWTLSPAFYDTARKNGGVFIISNTGKLVDWSYNLLTSYFETRPVITIKGSKEIIGSGTKENPYQYSGTLVTATKTDITNLSTLNNNSYYIAHINSPKKKVYGALSSTIKKQGLLGANTVYFNANKDKISVLTAEEMTFKDGTINDDGSYAYKIVNPSGKYLKLNSDNSIEFTDEETTLKVSLVTNTSYPGQIMITSLDGSVYLNFYGSESGNGDDFFAGWNEEDFNAYLSLYKKDN